VRPYTAKGSRTSVDAVVVTPMLLVPLVEVLSFRGCPHAEPAVALVRETARELGVAATVSLVEVADPETAIRLRFLGSPTIRVDGHDVEPGAERREDFALGCRIYRTRDGQSGLPTREWVRAALARA